MPASLFSRGRDRSCRAYGSEGKSIGGRRHGEEAVNVAARVRVLPNNGSAGINANRSRADRILRINRDGRRPIRKLQKAVIAARVVDPDECSRWVDVPGKGADTPWYIVRLELTVLHDVSMGVPRRHVSPAPNNGVAAGSRTIVH